MQNIVRVLLYQVFTGHEMTHMLKSSSDQMGPSQIQTILEGVFKISVSFILDIYHTINQTYKKRD